MDQNADSRFSRHEPRENAFLDFLRARPREAGEGLRTNPRHESTVKARLSWNEGEKNREVPARLINICRTGAALLVASPPPESATVLLRLLDEAPTPWIEAAIIGVEPIRSSRYRVRIKFHEFCPAIFLKCAVLGDPAFGAGETPEGEDRHEIP